MSTGISVDGYEPAHLSYSTIDGYRTCGMRMRLQKVIGVEQRPGVAALGGNAVHTASELWDLGTLAEQPAIPTAGELFIHAWNEEVEKRQEQSPSFKPEDYIVTGRATKECGGKKNIAWWMDHGPQMVQSWIDWRLDHQDWSIWETPEGKPAIELGLNIELPNGIPIKMFLDRVMVTPTGQITVLDIKTGRVPETPEQLGLYATGLEIEYGHMFRPAFGYYWHPDKGHGSPLFLEMYTPDYFADVAAGAARGINAGSFLAKPQFGCANWCSVAAHCPAVGGALPSFSLGDNGNRRLQ